MQAAYRRRIARNKAQYSLDCEDGIEYSACLRAPTPEIQVLRAERGFYLRSAWSTLTDVHNCCASACVLDEKSYAEVGRAEGVHSVSVRILRSARPCGDAGDLEEHW